MDKPSQPLTVPSSEGLGGVVEQRADAGTDWPIARLTVDDSGLVQRAGLYAPGLPPGDHDVWCLPVEAEAELAHLRALRRRAAVALKHVLTRIRDDPRVRLLMGEGSQTFDLATEAYAALIDTDLARLRQLVDGEPPNAKISGP